VQRHCSTSFHIDGSSSPAATGCWALSHDLVCSPYLFNLIHNPFLHCRRLLNHVVEFLCASSEPLETT
jgi:hypothetical protein